VTGVTSNGSGSGAAQATTGGGTASGSSTAHNAGESTSKAAASVNRLVPGVQSCSRQLSPVVIGSVGEQSGLAGSAVAGGAQTVQAWVSYVNSLGGLRCHPIKYIAADDGADPSRNASLTQQLVEQDGVVAFVYNDAPLASSGSLGYLVKHSIPVIGNEGGEVSMYQHPNLFPQASGGDALVYATFAGIAEQFTSNQRNHFGVLSCIEAAECSTVGKAAVADTKATGLNLVYNGSASLTAPDFTSQCLKAKQSGVQALLVVLDPNSVHRAAANCRNVGYNGLIATGSIIVIADLAADPNLAGLIFAGTVTPWMVTSNPQVNLMRQVLAKYAPGVSPVGSPGLGWTAAQLFAKSSTYWPNTQTINSADVLNAMDKVRNYDVDGMTGPMTFHKGQNAPSVTCWYEVAVRNKQFHSPDNGKRACK
jgi:branched-chain amino acid transport system substrate-binding protein